MIAAIIAAAVAAQSPCINPHAPCPVATGVVICFRVPNPPEAVRQGSPAYIEACNVTPPGWRPMSSAPRDGTVIEIRNAFGSEPPSYTIGRWADFAGEKGWVSAAHRPPCKNPPPVEIKTGNVTVKAFTVSCGAVSGYTSDAEPGLAWRPFAGDPATWCWRDHNPYYARALTGCGN